MVENEEVNESCPVVAEQNCSQFEVKINFEFKKIVFWLVIVCGEL